MKGKWPKLQQLSLRNIIIILAQNNIGFNGNAAMAEYNWREIEQLIAGEYILTCCYCLGPIYFLSYFTSPFINKFAITDIKNRVILKDIHIILMRSKV